MRLVLIFTVALTLTILVFGNDANAASETCKFKTADIGTVFGRGGDADSAFEDAVTKCVERRQAMFEERGSLQIRSLSSDGNDEYVERSEMYIDLCVNLKCS